MPIDIVNENDYIKLVYSYTDPITEGQLRSTGNVWKIDGDTNQLNIISVPHYGLFAPSCWYDNERTYLAHRKSHTTTDGTAGIIQYYNEAITNEFMSAAPTLLDYHDNPTVITDGAGTIWIIHEQHNVDKSELWKTTTPYDITSFSAQSDTAIIGDYPKTFKISSNSYFTIGRKGSGTELYITSFDGSSWGTPVKATQTDAEGDEAWHYPYYLINGNDDDGWFHLKFSKRVEDGTITWYKYIYHAKIHEDNIYKWYNVDGSYSKDVNISGYLTETELNANYLYKTNTKPGATDGSGGGAGLVYDNNVYQMNKTSGSDYYLYEHNSGWNSYVQSDSDKVKLLLFKDSQYKSIGIENDNTLAIYETTDFLSWTKVGNIFSETIHGLLNVITPYNFNEIPAGQKFCLFASSYKNSDSTSTTGTENNHVYAIEVVIDFGTNVTASLDTNHILFWDSFNGSTIDTNKWNETEGTDTTVTQDEQLIFTDITTDASADASYVETNGNFNRNTTGVTTVIKFDLDGSGLSDASVYRAFRFVDTADNNEIQIRRDGTPPNTDAFFRIKNSGSWDTDIDTNVAMSGSWKIVMTGGTATAYRWGGTSWGSSVGSGSYTNASDYYLDIRRALKSTSGNIWKIDNVFVTNEDFSTLDPL
jgi:hypothetical protein